MCKTVLHDTNVDIQAPCGGTRDLYFRLLHSVQATLSALQLSLSLILLLCHTLKQNLYVSRVQWSFCCVLVSLRGSVCTRFGKLQGASWCKSVRHSLKLCT